MLLTTEAKWTQALRDEYHKTHPENFAGPHASFPIRDASDVGDAWDLAGHAANPDAVRAKIKSIASRLGFTDALPDTAKQEDAATATIVDASIRPKKKIATLPVSWLEYNAYSHNKRIYPKGTCDSIYVAASRQMSNENALPPTCFVSHEAANGNVNTELVGHVSRVWQEGSKFWANINIADTSTARDMLGLIENGSLRAVSMRVLGVELRYDNGYDLPLVVVQEGAVPELLGIDLTTRPGLMDTARITSILYESAESPTIHTECFALDALSIESKEPAPPEETPLFQHILTGYMSEACSAEQGHQRVHDHLARVLDETIKALHSNEAALPPLSLSEAGRALATKNAKRLAAAHDEAAKHCSMSCEGCYNEALGIASNKESKGDNPMTEQEMLEALKAKGYGVVPPKTTEEQLAEMRTQLEEQQRVIAELRQQGTAAPPQRLTQALTQEGAQGALQPESLYQEGDYLQGDLRPGNWPALSNRQVPWPVALDPRVALHELAPFFAHRLLSQEANAMGRPISSFVGLDERV